LSKHRLLGYGQRLPDAFVEPIQEFISTFVSPNLSLSLLNSTTVQIVAGSDNDQVCIGISGKWRYNVVTINRAHPGGAAGTYDVWVVTTDNSYAGVPEVDSTVYAFDLRIVTSGSSPVTGAGATFWGRKIGQLTWDGASITSITQNVGGSGGGTGYGAGIILDFEGPEANIPPNTCVADGRYLDNVANPEHFARVGNTWNNFRGLATPPAGKHRVIDLRGLHTVGLGNMGTGNASTPTVIGGILRSGINTLTTFMGEEFHTLLTAEIPAHQHGGSTGAEAAHTHSGTTAAGTAHSHAATGLTFTGTGGTTAGQSVDHTHSGTTGGQSADHTHQIQANATGPNSGSDGVVQDTGRTADHTVPTGGVSNDHTHSFTSGGVSVGHTHTFTPAGTLGGTTATESAHTHTFTTGAGTSHLHSISLEGGGGSHENVPPVGVVVKVVTLR
jgi:hypothetical protein